MEEMMKHWLIDRFLPMWAKETVLADNRRLQQENLRLSHRVRELESYIRGVQRVCPRVIIRQEGK